MSFPVHVIPGGTIKDGVLSFYNEALKNAKEYEDYGEYASRISETPDDNYYKSVYQLVQLILYICAQNKEIQEDEVTKRTYRKPKNKEFIKDKFREVQKWNLGNDTASIIRKMNKSSSVRYVYSNSEDMKVGTPKSPHVRRGHWHHYWTGSRTEESKRQSILKWIPPTFVNANKVEESLNVTINKIKED